MTKEDGDLTPRATALGRRDLMKMSVGAGVVAMAQILDAPIASAQEAPTGPAQGRDLATSRRASFIAETGAGWKNDANRASGNGPMDATSRQLVEYVSSFSETILTDSLVDSLGDTMVDAMAALIAGFESEPARICARMARSTQSDLKSTVLGYGITTSPELAAYANSSMLRHADFNDDAPGAHVSTIIPGILAIGEALHSTGSQVLLGVTLGYELVGGLTWAGGNQKGLDSWPYGPATALVVGKLLGLNEDQLANALSLALVPNIPLRVNRAGALSMAKGCCNAPAIRNAVFSALLAREGMTGACQPFEARDGLWDRITGPFTDLRLPAGPTPKVGSYTNELDGRMCVQRERFKRYPSEGSTLAVLELIPAIRAWTQAVDIASIRVDFPFEAWMEIGDPPKWDPRNRETADHSIAYVLSRALIDGEIYLDSFTPEKIMDPVVRRLMEKVTVRPDPNFTYQGQVRLTVRTKAGGQLVKEIAIRSATPMTHQEVVAKFNRVCAFMQVADDQRDRALAQWSNLRAVKDIAEPMRTLANFGRPLPL